MLTPMPEGPGARYTISSPFAVTRAPKVAVRRAPEIGEHTEDVLEELGYDAQRIQALRSSGVIN